MLKITKNNYNGIVLNGENFQFPCQYLAQLLKDAIQDWIVQKLDAVWITVPATHIEYLPVLMKLGFQLHHCTAEHITINLKLQEDIQLPDYATHTIGVGGVVINDNQEILVVVEKHDMALRPHYYKLPGGLLEKGEHIETGVIREIYEETGIRAQFQSLVSLRHRHQEQFVLSNMYIVCRLKASSTNIQLDPSEIGYAAWMSIEDYLACETVSVYNKSVVRMALKHQHLNSIKLEGYLDPVDAYEIFMGSQ